jgi:glycosyltransferase involved in cell wall biosynthesis
MQEPSDNPPHGSSPGGKCLAIVPAYNESASVAGVVEDLRQHLPHADVLVIDDGSTDGTHASVPDGTFVIRLPFNLGIGAAMQAGYRYAKMHHYDTAIQIDGDGQHPADQTHKLIQALHSNNADLVIGSRFLKDEPGYTPSASRAFGIGVIRTVVRLLTGLRVTDCTSGMRACNRRVIEAFARWYPDDYPEPEVILLLHRAGFTIQEVPVTMRQRAAGRTSIPFLKGVFYILKVSLALLLDTTRRPWPTEKARSI